MSEHLNVEQTGDRPKSAEYRAKELARDYLAMHGDDAQGSGNNADKVFRAAFEEWLPEIETDADLVIAVVGRQVWQQAATAFLRREMLSNRGRAMHRVQQETAGFVQASVPRPSGDRISKAVEVELGILGTVMIGTKQLAFCTKAEVVAEQRRSKSRAEFLAAIVELLPADDAVVKDFITPKKASKLSVDLV